MAISTNFEGGQYSIIFNGKMTVIKTYQARFTNRIRKKHKKSHKTKRNYKDGRKIETIYMRIDQELHDTIFGYVKSVAIKFESIPLDIVYFILLFYDDKYEFNANCFGENIKFPNKTTAEMTVTAYNRVSTCIFGERISIEQCNKFDIYLKWKKSMHCFYMGYIYGPSLEDFEFNEALGCGKNKSCSVGIIIRRNNDEMHLYDKNNDGKSLDNFFPNRFKQKDIFRISFNLKNDKLTLYHNGNALYVISLNGYKSIIPALSLCATKGECVQVVHCKLS